MTCPVIHVASGFNPLDPEQDAWRYEIWRLARATEPVFYSPSLDVWFITRWDDVDVAQRDHKHFSTESVFYPSKPWPDEVRRILDTGFSWKYLLSNNDPPEHTPLKRAVIQAFTRNQTAKLENRIRVIAEELIDQFLQDGRADIGDQFAYPFPAYVVLEILGFPRDDMRQLKMWGDDWLTLFSDSADVERLQEAARGFVAFQNYVYEHLKARRDEPREDLLSALVHELHEAADATFSIEDIVNVPINIMTAGHATGTLLMSGILYQLLQDPHLMGQVSADPELVPTLVEEALRFEPPVHGIFRTVKEAVTVRDVTIPKDARVLLVYGSANHDPAAFDNPDQFDITRENLHKHFGFGKGTHFCPGAPIARLEQRIAIETLLRKCPNLRLVPDIEPTALHHFWLRGLTNLWVEWDVPAAS